MIHMIPMPLAVSAVAASDFDQITRPLYGYACGIGGLSQGSIDAFVDTNKFYVL